MSTTLVAGLTNVDLLEEMINIGTLSAFVTVSIGAATALPAPEFDPSQLLATADAALYRAKHAGRNRIRSWAVAAA